MRSRRPFLRLAGWAAAILLVALVAVPVTTGRPVLSYPVSASMVPTLGPFDVFFVDPWPGALHVGDIVVFDSVARGAPAVHRIVGGDPSGWITQGDANPNVDQLGGEPPVTPERILGRVVTYPSGVPVRIPGLGASVTEAKVQATRLHDLVGAQGDALPVALVGAGLLLALLVPRGKRRPRPAMDRAFARPLRRAFPRGILGRHLGFALLALLALASIWSAHQARADVPTSLVVVQDPSAADPYRAAPPGGSLPRTLQVGSLGLLPTLAVLEPGTPGIAVPERVTHVASWSTARVEVREVAGPDVGHQQDAVQVWRYPDVLPTRVTLALHDAAPGSPDVALGALCALGGYAWYRVLAIGPRPVARWLGLREGWL